jgi:CBS domain-containing protein
MKVRDAMSAQPIVLRETDSVLAGLKLLVQQSISGAPVVSSDDRVVGMVTEFDLLLAVDCVGEAFPIAKVMHKDVISVQADATLEEARYLILTHNHRRLPVLDGDKLVGVLARRDLLRVRLGL